MNVVFHIPGPDLNLGKENKKKKSSSGAQFQQMY